MFRKREKPGSEHAIHASVSQDQQEPETRDETLPPPKPRGKWTREDSEGINENIHLPETSDEHTFQAKVTARYPETDHNDHPLNPMITQFCYPVGDVVVPTKDYQMPRVHHFVLTNDRGSKVYGTCLTIYEEYHPPEGTSWRRPDHIHGDAGERDIEVTVDDKVSALYLPRCLCILSIWPYVRAFREYLAQLYRLATSTNCMSAPIERYIMNICMEIPAPPPGAFEVQVNILDSVIRFWSPPAKLPIAYVAMPYQTLFDCLDVQNVLHLWYCLTMERKVLLVSSQYSILTVCSEILCSLLYPMKWSHLYVPLLPRFLSPILDAPVPYLCGITRENWLHVQQFISEETIVVDLDRNSLMFGEKTMPLPPVPGKKWKKLQNSLEEIAGHFFWRTRGLENEYRQFTHDKLNRWGFKKIARKKGEVRWNERLETFDQAFNLQFTPDSENLKTDASIEKERSQWEQLQELFLRFFVALLKDYRKFLHVPDAGTPLSPTPGSADWFKWSSRRSFDTQGFLAYQKPEYLPYLSELSSTQQFDDFVTKRLYSPEMPDIIFFDQSIDAKLNRSRLRLRKVETPFLQSAKAHKVLKTFLAVEPSTSDLPSEGPYMYKNWPETFDNKLFCEPRRIPKMITAEFDRQAALVSRLRSNHSPGVDENSELLDLYGGDYDTSPEGMAFTVFFFAYSAIIGREWQEYQVKRRKLLVSTRDASEVEPEVANQRQDFHEEQDPVEVASTDPMLSNNTNALSDLTLGVCESCPEGATALNNAFTYVAGKSPCCDYVDKLNSQAQEAIDTISQLAYSQSGDFQQPPDTSLLDSDGSFAEFEEAREVAIAQLDLAFDTLKAMQTRGLVTDPDVFKSLMEACGRCGDTKRALGLIEMMKRDGLVADKEVLSCFMAAFAHDEGEEFGSLSIKDDFIKGRSRSSDAYSAFLKKKLEKMSGGSTTGTLQTASSDEESSIGLSDVLSDSGSEVSALNSPPKHTTASTLFEWLTPHKKPTTKKKRRRRRRKSSVSKETITDRLMKQLVLGESLLDFLYPGLVIDLREDTCPQCSQIMNEHDIISGWQPCEFQDFTTCCPQCRHRFVPRFSVLSTSPSFVGSQGPGTPLYCEFLSPWVLRKELHHIITGEAGIDLILDPEWRSGTGVRATLWWNLIVMFKRYQLPFSFLLQGSFSNRLISPVPQD